MAKLSPQTAPPPDYYAENLVFLVENVVSEYSDVLSSNEAKVAQSILLLSVDGKRLFARIAMRKVEMLRVDKVNYAEVANLEETLDELAFADLVDRNLEIELGDSLCALTISELRNLVPELKLKGRKNEHVKQILESNRSDDIGARVHRSYRWFQLCVHDELRIFSLLFFGNLRDDFSAFVLRDLGLFRFENYRLDRTTRLFPDRESIDTYIRISNAQEIVEELGMEVDDTVATGIVREFANPVSHPILERKRSKLLNVIGRNFERSEGYVEALDTYSYSTLPPARERIARIFRRQGNIDECSRILTTIRDDPWSLEELEFARSFGRKKSRNEGLCIEKRKLNVEIPDSIEEHAIRELQLEGYEAWHFENLFPLAVFGLLYWDWIFSPSEGAFVNAFQNAPIDLFMPEFFERRKVTCADPLVTSGSLKREIVAWIERKSGVSNALVDWRVCTSDAFRKCLDAISTQELTVLLEILVKDLRQLRSGFPDLTAIDCEGHIEFIEVKSPSDQLQRNQLIWIRELTQAKVPVKVLRYVYT